MNRLSPFNSSTAPQTRSPGRGLAVLAALVVAAHALLLTNAVAWFGRAAAPNRADAPARAFATRRIQPRPVPVATAAAEETPATPRSVSKRFLQPKKPLAQNFIASLATESIANEASRRDRATDADATATALPDLPALPAMPGLSASAPAEVTPQNSPPQILTPVTATSGAASASALPVTTPVTSVNLPASAILGYEMTGSAKGLTYHANAKLDWRNLGDHYDARMTVSAFFLGSRSMASVGQLGTGGLAPTRFSDKTRSEVAAHFEPDKGLITFSANTPSAPWVPGAQDRISVFLQISGLIAGSPADFPVGTTVVMYTAGPRSADIWTFTVAGEELLYLPYGNVQTLKLQRKPQRDYDQMVEIWLAPALDYLPVRNKITQSNGDFIDQQFTGLTRP